MARSQSKGSLQDRISRENARKESRYAAPKPPGGGSLPSGIENGIAKLTRVDFDTIENGNYAGSQRFYCHGVCVLPKEHEGIRCEGRLVQPGMITLDDVKSTYGDTTFAENVQKAEARLKLLGFPTEEFEDIESDTLNYFETGDEMYFEFRTWSPQDSDRVLIQIMGPASWAGDNQDEIEEDSPAVSSANTSAPAEPKQEVKAEVAPSLQALARLADGGDEDSQIRIANEAEKLGINPEDEIYANWGDVVSAIESAETSDAGEVTNPEVGDVFRYRPPRSRSDKDCEVLEVNEEFVKLKSLDDDKEYDDVPITALAMIT